MFAEISLHDPRRPDLAAGLGARSLRRRPVEAGSQTAFPMQAFELSVYFLDAVQALVNGMEIFDQSLEGACVVEPRSRQPWTVLTATPTLLAMGRIPPKRAMIPKAESAFADASFAGAPSRAEMPAGAARARAKHPRGGQSPPVRRVN